MNIRRIFTGTVFIAFGYHIISTEGDTRTGNKCIEDLSKAFTVQLQCPVGECIHVVHEAYGDRDKATCRLKSADSCNKLHATSQHGLIVNCNGKQSCFEVMKVQSSRDCNITDGAAAAEVKYNCIKGSVNMCSPVTTTVNGSVYLHSPGFPDSVGVNRSCVVRILGQSLQVTLLEQRIRSRELNISGDGRQLWTSVNVDQYNRVLSETAAEIVILYDNHDQNGSNVWIRVADSGPMNITITGEILDASTTSTQQPPRSQSMSSPSKSDTPTTVTTSRAYSTATASLNTVTSTRGLTTHSTRDTATQLSYKSTTAVSTTVSTTDTGNSGDVVIAVSVVCGILVLIVVVLLIYFMVVKPFRKKHGTSSNTGTSTGHGETNVYDGIQRSISNASEEHNYCHITSSGGPVYENAVNGEYLTILPP